MANYGQKAMFSLLSTVNCAYFPTLVVLVLALTLTLSVLTACSNEVISRSQQFATNVHRIVQKPTRKHRSQNFTTFPSRFVGARPRTDLPVYNNIGDTSTILNAQ